MPLFKVSGAVTTLQTNNVLMPRKPRPEGVSRQTGCAEEPRGIKPKNVYDKQNAISFAILVA